MGFELFISFLQYFEFIVLTAVAVTLPSCLLKTRFPLMYFAAAGEIFASEKFI